MKTKYSRTGYHNADLDRQINSIARISDRAQGGDDIEKRPNILSLVTISLTQEFEPWGRASENWEDVWEVRLPALNESFKGRTMREALEKALTRQ